MKVEWSQFGGAASAVVLSAGVLSAAVVVLMMSAPVRASETPGITAVAVSELDKRSKQAAPVPGKGMSDSAVRVLMTYAFSIIPENAKGPDGKPMKIDKSNPKPYFIPTADARRVIRAATRSAYAEVCDLPKLAQANFETLTKGEEARGTWSPQQMQMINALYLFSVSYFTGNVKITPTDEPADPTPAGGSSVAAKGSISDVADSETTRVFSAEPPKCPPEQKKKVINAINAYVQGAKTAPAKP